jgi:chromate reductase
VGQRRIAVVVGSLRKGSHTRKVARTLIGLAPGSLTCELVEIRDLALYDQDLEDAPPASWVTFRERLRAADAALFVTPEYNRSVPGGLKNALDVGSRPPPKSVWKGKPAGIVSVTTGRYGAFGANHHLRQSLVFLDMPTLQQPEAYLSGAAELFDSEGTMTDEHTRELLQRFMTAFAAWVDRTAARV